MITIKHIIKIDEYLIKDEEKREIYVEISNDKITLHRHNSKGDTSFRFIKSNPDTVRAIGEMLIEASKIIIKDKENNKDEI